MLPPNILSIEPLYNRGLQTKNCKAQTLFRKEFLGKPKDNSGDKNKGTKGNWSL